MADLYSDYKSLKFNRPKPRILEVIFSNPGKLNAVDETAHGEIGRVWRDVDKDDETSVVLLRGEGGTFSAGGDLKLVEKMSQDYETRLRLWKESHDLVYNIINCTKPVVAAIEGPAVGAGLTAGMLADIVVVGRTARIIDGHTRLGVVAGDHAAMIWPLLCGMAKSKYYLLLCETVTGEEAERIGLASVVAEDGEVIDTAMEICEKLAGGAQTAIRLTKHALNNWLRMAGPTFDTSLALEFVTFAGPEVREGYSSLMEKRKPNFPPDSPF